MVKKKSNISNHNKILRLIRKSLREASIYSPYRAEALRKSKVRVIGKDKRGVKRERVYYVCACCGEKFQVNEVEVDHIVEIGEISKLEDIQVWINKLFCTDENLQVLCIPCHKNKSITGTIKRAKINKDADLL